MSNKRHNHLKRGEGKNGKWLHPTKGYRRTRRNPNLGMLVLTAFASRVNIPADRLKPWRTAEDA